MFSYWKVVLNWFWGDVQRELSVGGDVPQPARTWGLHSMSLFVKGVEEEINPTQYSEVWKHGCVGGVETWRYMCKRNMKRIMSALYCSSPPLLPDMFYAIRYTNQVQGVVKYLWSIVELLEAHFLDSWLPSGSFSSKSENDS